MAHFFNIYISLISGSGCDGINGGHDAHVCVLRTWEAPVVKVAEVTNFAGECWAACGFRQGPCPGHCGKRGVCCRQKSDAWPLDKAAQEDSGCDGTNGGAHTHLCAVASETNPPAEALNLAIGTIIFFRNLNEQ
jgi:hypothetical protein